MWPFTSLAAFGISDLKLPRFLQNPFRKRISNGETGVPVLEEDIVWSDFDQWRAVVGAVPRLRRTRRGMRRGVSSRPQHPRVPRHFLHHHLWTMAQAPALVPQEHGHGGPSIM
ncbi:hypothetical protein Taro_003073 [Colocasia esculenta]|uniref:Uncharacterized protein n=1 Tax=Colocasia esculenta TaxID=4460 RepID=A0A843TKZ5_COLES|nr:hypothetical protein [Colocasia esculenta]